MSQVQIERSLTKLTEMLNNSLNVSGFAVPDAPFSLLDEYLFWIVQMGEHAFFLSSGIDEPSLEVVSKKYANPKAIKDLKAAGARFYSQTQTAKNQKTITIQEIPGLLKWLDKLEEWENQVLTVTSTDWIGYVYPSVVEHYIEELEYFRKRLQFFANEGSEMTPEEVINTWNDWAKDHGEIIVRLLDPKEEAYFEQVLNQTDVIKRIIHDKNANVQHLIDLSLGATEELNMTFGDILVDLENHTLLSVIHPALLAHIIREGNRAVGLMSQLN